MVSEISNRFSESDMHILFDISLNLINRFRPRFIPNSVIITNSLRFLSTLLSLDRPHQVALTDLRFQQKLFEEVVSRYITDEEYSVEALQALVLLIPHLKTRQSYSRFEITAGIRIADTFSSVPRTIEKVKGSIAWLIRDRNERRESTLTFVLLVQLLQQYTALPPELLKMQY